MIKASLFIVIISIFVSSCSTRPTNNGQEISLEELSFEFHKQLDKHNVKLPIITEYISEYGMYILRIDESKYFKQNASISIHPEQVNEFDKLVLKLKRAMKVIDNDGGKLGAISFSMAYNDKKEFSRRSKAYWDGKDSLKEN